MGVQAELVLLIMFASTVKTQEVSGGVEFWRNTVTLNCPGEGTWYDSEKNIHNGSTLQVQYDSEKKPHNGTTLRVQYKHALRYRCEYTVKDPEFQTLVKKTYFFYVKGRTCENCFEVDASVFGLVIIVDVAGTAGLMMIIYRRTKKRSSDGPAQPPKPPVPSGSRPSTAPRGTYEELQPRTRASETYSTVNRVG